MPNRNLVYEALALRSRESPAGDRILCLMTAEAGIVDVFVFGGPKSKLRSLAAPYSSGRAFVYLDPAKDFRKLSDFEVRDSYPSLREDLGKLWSAGLVAELLIKTSGGGGDFPIVLELALSCLAALDAAPPGSYGPALVLFLWRLVELLGLGPDPSSCSSCGREFIFRRPVAEGKRATGGFAEEAREGSGEEIAGAYSFESAGFLCANCAARAERCLRLGVGALRWLSRSLELPYADAIRLPLLPHTLETLKLLSYGLARAAAEAPLASLEGGDLSQ